MKRADAIQQLQRNLRQQQLLCDDLLTQLAEANLKLRFIMQAMRVAHVKPGAQLLDADGKQQVQIMDGMTAYVNGGRDEIIGVIEKEMAAYEAAEAADRERRTAGRADHPADGRTGAEEDDAAPDHATEARP